jgi:hypothetical protein
MVVALRALRFCYGNSLLHVESLLYKDRWEQTRGLGVVVKESKQTTTLPLILCGLQLRLKLH